MTLPQETKSKIIAEARQYASDKIPNDDYVDNALCSYVDGATEWAGKAEGLAGALESALRYAQPQGLTDKEYCESEKEIERISDILAKYKEVGNEKK